MGDFFAKITSSTVIVKDTIDVFFTTNNNTKEITNYVHIFTNLFLNFIKTIANTIIYTLNMTDLTNFFATAIRNMSYFFSLNTLLGLNDLNMSFYETYISKLSNLLVSPLQTSNNQVSPNVDYVSKS